MSVTDRVLEQHMTSWLDQVIPTHSFLDRYMKYTEPLSDTPRVFNFACGLATLAAAVGRNITYRFGDDIVTPNLWILLLAPTGACRKTTSMSMAKRVLRNTNPEALYPNEMTPEAMLKVLAEHPQGLMTHSEFAGFMALLSRSYMAGMKETLTDLYDSPPVYTRKLANEKPIEIVNPALSMLAGSTISWLVEQMKAADLRGGWLVRFLMVPVWHRERFIGIPPAADHSLHEALVLELKGIADLKGQVSLAGVRDQYTDWLRRLNLQSEVEDNPEVIAGFVARLSQSALKIAILLEASNGLVGISEESLGAAMMFVEHALADTKRLLREEFADRWIEREARRIEKRLLPIPGRIVDHSSLLRFSGLSTKQFKDVVLWMTETDQLEIIDDQKPKLYRLKVREIRSRVPNE